MKIHSRILALVGVCALALLPGLSGAGLFEVITGLKPADNGRFLDYQGETMPW